MVSITLPGQNVKPPLPKQKGGGENSITKSSRGIQSVNNNVDTPDADSCKTEGVMPDNVSITVYEKFSSVASTVGLDVQVNPHANEATPVKLLWGHGGDVEVPSALIFVDSPCYYVENAQWEVVIPPHLVDYATSRKLDFWLFFYISYKSDTLIDGVHQISGIWGAHIDEVIPTIAFVKDGDGKKVYFVDVRYFDLYSLNSGGVPVRLIMD